MGIYTIIDQGVTISYMKEGYGDSKADLETLISVIEHTDQSKDEIEVLLKEHRLYEFMNFSSDTVALERVMLIFEDNLLQSVEKQW